LNQSRNRGSIAWFSAATIGGFSNGFAVDARGGDGVAVFSSLPDPQPAIVKASIPINAIVESRCIAGSPKLYQNFTLQTLPSA